MLGVFSLENRKDFSASALCDEQCISPPHGHIQSVFRNEAVTLNEQRISQEQQHKNKSTQSRVKTCNLFAAVI